MKIKNLESFYNLIEALEHLPSIGKKSAEKMAYTLCVDHKSLGQKIAQSIQEASQKIRKCKWCRGLSEEEECQICQDQSRNNGELCIVAHPRDIAIIENIDFFQGKYYVLESIEMMNLDHLVRLISHHGIEEVIFGFSPSLANDALILFVEDRLKPLNLHFSKIAQGVPTGIGLDHIDHLSLSSAFRGRRKI
ncbi:recombination mediator RecR [Helicobacter pametensis]|uniref:recombination mediator RecR n=1 Tax=Helicobacter pametensis TaxID=95149 RepID=UPI0004857061|nr:recombination mediator RecR [Helicobacter pametensis]